VPVIPYSFPFGSEGKPGFAGAVSEFFEIKYAGAMRIGAEVHDGVNSALAFHPDAGGELMAGQAAVLAMIHADPAVRTPEGYGVVCCGWLDDHCAVRGDRIDGILIAVAAPEIEILILSGGSSFIETYNVGITEPDFAPARRLEGQVDLCAIRSNVLDGLILSSNRIFLFKRRRIPVSGAGPQDLLHIGIMSDDLTKVTIIPFDDWLCISKRPLTGIG